LPLPNPIDFKEMRFVALPGRVHHQPTLSQGSCDIQPAGAEDMSARSGIPLVDRAFLHRDRIALIDGDGSYTYGDLLDASEHVASSLLDGRADLQEARVAFIVPPSFAYVSTLWGIWRGGGIGVPLCVSHPAPELAYVIQDADAEIIVAHPDYIEMLEPVAKKQSRSLLSLTDFASQAVPSTLPGLVERRRAMLIYTSGTTGKPKGVVTSHGNVRAQIEPLVQSWGWQQDDRILGILPLHHVHGIINVLCCALWSGACCELMEKFSPEAVWDCFVTKDYSLFMAVPTVYVKLIGAWENSDPEIQREMARACRKMRLMVSGSAALPVSVFEKWRTMTGHTFLERYGMTEIGMGLSNPLEGERRPGYVGVPLPGVSVRLVEDSGRVIESEGIPGELQVKGDNVFSEYWRRPEETRKSFSEGWFLTGDTVVVEDGYYRILGRNSVDIIKTGGYKVSALEIEEVLRTHSAIRECAVVGVADDEWGERVAAAVVLKPGQIIALDELRSWAKPLIAPYKVPSLLAVVDDLPRNAMGKVTKPDVKHMF
jgi:malonyl-CoA/methylmalonyl-CoA synthetase